MKLTGDFNLNLKKYMQNTELITVTVKSATLIDNILTNSYEHNSNCVPSNITTYISDHLLQFLITENLKQLSLKQNPTISFRDHKNLMKRLSKQNLLSFDWSFVTENNDINLSFETFLHIINRNLDKYAPVKTVKKRENKIISKSWITRDIKFQ